ncbi:MAG: right-handed parallel beta-helix repeat-containing protein [Candidatus Hydrogenedentes bacterium]|nr:right-handed parallel beta-helix repeat-containing protein [Candidatus Hydrogenedentota bacterium]
MPVSSRFVREVFLCGLAILALTLLGWGATARAASMIVTDPDDTTDGGNTTSVTALNSNPGSAGLSFYEALLAANADAGIPDQITFAPGITTIAMNNILPPITDTLSIMGGGVVDIPFLGDFSGLRVHASNCILDGLMFRNSVGGSPNIAIGQTTDLPISADNNIITNCKIGTDGFTVLGGGEHGIAIYYGSNNRIGGSTAAARNIIGGNSLDGVYVTQPPGLLSDGNQIMGNYLGVGADGVTPVSNGQNPDLLGSGVEVENASNTLIHGNLISGNRSHGITLRNTLADPAKALGTVVTGNLIGTDATGLLRVMNEDNGIYLENMSGVLIGGATAAGRNIVSGNGFYGITCETLFGSGGQSQNVHIFGNYIGVGADGSTTIVNPSDSFTQFTGISVYSGSASEPITGLKIGDTAAGAGNVISGNDSSGIQLYGNGIVGPRIQGNIIGLDSTGLAEPGLQDYGISVGGGVSGTVIGGANDSARNIVSGNVNTGIIISDGEGTLDGFVIANNYIGLGSDLSAHGNVSAGIALRAASINGTIGGSLNAANIIAYNGAGVDVQAPSAQNRITFNSIHDNTAAAIFNEMGAQNNISRPILTNVMNTPPFTISGSTGTPGGTIQIFADADEEARYFIGEGTANGNGGFAIDLNLAPYDLMYIKALVVDSLNNTSELSTFDGVPGLPLPNIAPTVKISKTSAQASQTSTAPIDFDVQSDEPLMGLTAADFINDGTAGVSFTLDPITDTAWVLHAVNPTSDGDVIPHLLTETYTDLAGNSGTGAVSSDVVVFDTTPPAIVLSAPSVSLTRSGPVTFTITYTGASNITLANGDVSLNATGTANGTVGVSGAGTTERTVTISGITGDGTLGISLASGTAVDGAGNLTASAGPSSTFVVDNTMPTLSIGAPSVSVTKAGPVTFTVNYTGASLITLGNGDVTLNKTGTANGIIGVSGAGSATRTVTISSITGNGTLGISLASGTAVDAAGNLAGAGGPSTLLGVDNTPPTLSIGAPSAAETKSGPVTFTVDYTGASNVTLANGDVTLNKTGTANGTVAVSGAGTSTRTVTISGITGDGTLGIALASGTAADTVNNLAASAGPSATFNVDNTGPSVSIGAPSLAETNSGPVTFAIDYTGASNVTLANGDVTLSTTGTANGTIAVSGAGTATRTVTISGITGDGALGISLASGTASDSLGNLAASAGISSLFTVDNTPPEMTIGAPSVLATKSGPVTYTINYTSASVISLDNGDVTLNKTGTANGTIAVTGTGIGTVTRTVTISGITGDGALGISLASGTATDDVDNLAAPAGPSATFIVDNTAPAVSIGAPSVTETNSGPVTFAIDYTGASNVTLANGNVTLNKTGTANGTVAVSGAGTATRTVTISSITGDGALGITLASGTAVDDVDNLAAPAGPSATFIVDNTAPTSSIGAPSVAETKSGPVTFAINYTGASNVTLANGNVTLNKTGTANGTVAVSGAGTVTRTVTISGITGDGTLGITLATGTASDAAGNLAASSGPSGTFSVDNVAPGIAIGVPSAAITNFDPVSFAVNYSGASSVSLANGDVTLNRTGTANATVAVSGSGPASRLVTLSGFSGNGALGISIAAGTASDDTENFAPAAGPSTAFTVDTTPPVLTFISLTSDPTSSSPIPVTAMLSEPVVSLSPELLTLVNAIPTNISTYTPGTTILTFGLAPIESGLVSVSVAAGALTDAAGNTNVAAATFSRTYIDAMGAVHSGDLNGDFMIQSNEVLRAGELHEEGAYHCDETGVDGFDPGTGSEDCSHHSSDYAPADFDIDFDELVRFFQFAYFAAPDSTSPRSLEYRPDFGTEDGYILAVAADAVESVSMTRAVENGGIYTPGVQLEVTLEVALTGPEDVVLAIEEMLPPGWTFQGINNSAPGAGPAPDWSNMRSGGGLELAWYDSGEPLSFPFTVTYRVRPPAESKGGLAEFIAGRVIARSDGVAAEDQAEFTPLTSSTAGEGEGEGECETACADPDADADGDGLSCCEEFALGTSDEDIDSDDDGMPDSFEALFELDPVMDDAGDDLDGDILTNLEEFIGNSRPNDATSPGDTYFVSPDGADAPLNGSPSSPWQTIGFALSQVTRPEGEMAQIVLREGLYEEDVVLNPRIKLVGDTGADARILGTVTGAQDSALTGLTLLAPPGAEYIFEMDDVRMTVKRVIFRDENMDTEGNFLRAATGARIDGLAVVDSIFEDCAFSSLAVGMEIFNAIPRIRRCEFANLSTAGIIIRALPAEAPKAVGGAGKSLGEETSPESGWNRFLRTIEGPAVINERDEAVRMQNNYWGTGDEEEAAMRIEGESEFIPILFSIDSSILASSLFCTCWDAGTQKRVTNGRVSLAVSAFGPVSDNVDGVYAFPALPDGAYTASASANGYRLTSSTVTVNPGQIASVVLAMPTGEEEKEPGASCAARDAALTPGGDAFLMALLVIALLAGAYRHGRKHA